MKKYFLIIYLIIFFTTCATYNSVHPSRTSVNALKLPNLDGYITLKCDFHLHTVFSDGIVWPTVRVEEAYYDELDAIAITDHIEHRIYPKYSSTSHNRSYEEALKSNRANDVIIIKGNEITRSMPPGHFNALFLTDCDKLDQKDYIDVFRAAKEQNAFVSWNHPGWLKQQPDFTLWLPEHTQLLEEGLFQGIEVVNGGTYSPEAHAWCLEKNLAIISGTDTHARIEQFPPEKHRTMTLVFSRERSEKAIFSALMDRRSAVYLDEFIIGSDIHLKELFKNAVNIKITKSGKNTADIIFRNNTSLKFYIRKDAHEPRISYFRFGTLKPYIIQPFSNLTLTVKFIDNIIAGDVNLIVENFIVGPNTQMKYTIKIQ